MKTYTSRRMRPSFGYKGAIMNHSNTYSYNRRPAFSRIKEVYGETLERFKFERPKVVLKSNQLLARQKKEIRYRLKEQFKKERNRNIIILCFMIGFAMSFLYFMNHYFLDLMEILIK